MIAPKALSIFR